MWTALVGNLHLFIFLLVWFLGLVFTFFVKCYSMTYSKFYESTINDQLID